MSIKINNDALPMNIDDKGNIDFQLTDEMASDLMALLESKEYKTYRKILMGAKNAHTVTALSLEDPNKLLKQMGMIVGLNLAINQLVLLVDQVKKARLVKGESKNPGTPNPN